MSRLEFDYASLFRKDVAEPAPHWTGLPHYNFIGGHNDPDHIPHPGRWTDRSRHHGVLEQLVVAEYFTHHFAGHIQTLIQVLSEKLDTLVDAVEREFGTAAELWRPQGGIYLWLKLPDAIDVRNLVKPAADAGIAFNAGPLWAVDPEAARSRLRLCFALPSKEEIRNGVAALARVFSDNTGIPVHSANIRQTSAR